MRKIEERPWRVLNNRRRDKAFLLEESNKRSNDVPLLISKIRPLRVLKEWIYPIREIVNMILLAFIHKAGEIEQYPSVVYERGLFVPQR